MSSAYRIMKSSQRSVILYNRRLNKSLDFIAVTSYFFVPDVCTNCISSTSSEVAVSLVNLTSLPPKKAGKSTYLSLLSATSNTRSL